MLRLRAAVAAAALVIIPSLGIAQGAEPRTHTVKRGDTLWDLAKLYLNDAFLWPEIYRVNTDVIEDPHWIYPGEVLRIPDVGALTRRNPDEVAAQQPQRGATPAQTTPAPGGGRVTIPTRSLMPLRYVVRSGEYLAAPFVGPDGGPAGSGRVRALASGGDLARQTDGRMLYQMNKVVIAPPAGVRAVRGDRFLIIRLGEKLPGRGQVIEPVGTVRVEDPGAANGGEVLARVDLVFGAARVGDGLIPLDTLVGRTGVFPRAVDPVLSTNILWVQDKPELPSIGRYIVFSAAALDGVVTGDQITLVRERGKDGNGQQLADDVLGIAQILRVTDRGSSAIILRTFNSGTNVGTLGRLTAKMP